MLLLFIGHSRLASTVHFMEMALFNMYANFPGWSHHCVHFRGGKPAAEQLTNLSQVPSDGIGLTPDSLSTAPASSHWRNRQVLEYFMERYIQT